jgi:hypothetical protein
LDSPLTLFQDKYHLFGWVESYINKAHGKLIHSEQISSLIRRKVMHTQTQSAQLRLLSLVLILARILGLPGGQAAASAPAQETGAPSGREDPIATCSTRMAAWICHGDSMAALT